MNKSVLISEKGFTLIEALIALFVLTIGVLGMMTLQTTAIRSNYRASSMTTASNVAAKRIEEYRNSSFVSLPTPGSGVVTSTDQETGFTVQVQPTAGPIPAESRWIKVTVIRPGNSGKVTYKYLAIRDQYLQAP